MVNMHTYLWIVICTSCRNESIGLTIIITSADYLLMCCVGLFILDRDR